MYVRLAVLLAVHVHTARLAGLLAAPAPGDWARAAIGQGSHHPSPPART
ncbi:hypothetical protein ACWGN5_33865 [Streptomyces sp. NPDC055815]